MASPRYPQPWSPRRPSPLGTQPPLAPHMAFASPTFPPTPDRLLIPKGSTDMQMRFPPEARRAPLAGSTHRLRSHAPTPLNLSSTLHPPNSHQTEDSDDASDRKNRRRSLLAQQKEEPPAQTEPSSPRRRRQPSATTDMRVPPSPLASSTSSLSLYSADSTKKAHALGDDDDLARERRQQRGEETEKPSSVFCSCLNFKALFGSKSRKATEERILGPPSARPNPPPAAPQPNPNPNRRRPSPLNI